MMLSMRDDIYGASVGRIFIKKKKERNLKNKQDLNLARE